MKTAHLLRTWATALLATIILAACGAAPAAETAAPIEESMPDEQPTEESMEAPTDVPPTEAVDPTPEMAALEEVEPGLLGIDEVEQFTALFNADAGKTRLVLHLTMGCPSCVLGAEWINDRLLATNPDAEIVVYAVWFPTLEAADLPTGTDEMWDQQALDDPRVVHLWDQARRVSKYFAAEQPYEGIERSMLSDTFSGLQWGRNIWDVYFLYGPDAVWGDALDGLIGSGYPIIEQRDQLRDQLGLSLAAAAASDEAIQTFTILPAESSVSYGVHETFAGSDLNYAIGTTNEIRGEITVNLENPALSTVGEITVNIQSLSSDNWRRDERIQEQFLESATYPLATFTPTALRDLPATYTPGESLSFVIEGTLTVRDTDAPASFTIEARIEDGLLIGTASGQVLMTDFGFDPPTIGNVITAENEVDLTFSFVAEPAE